MIGSIEILGHTYRITEVPDVGQDWCARIHQNKCEIEIRKGQSKSMVVSAIIHESIEALNYQLELDLPHRVICQLEAGLFSILMDNKGILNHL